MGCPVQHQCEPETVIHTAVIGHVSRQAEAEQLTAQLGARLFLDTATHGAKWNHDRALDWGRTLHGHLLVVEDDAQPVTGFLQQVTEWVNENPADLISYYLGTGYPPSYQPRIRHLLTTAIDRILLPTLIHAVAYSIPCHFIPPVGPGKADTALGKAWRQTTNRPIIYTVPSLVNHTDHDSIQNRGHRQLPRTAHRLPGGHQQTPPEETTHWGSP